MHAFTVLMTIENITWLIFFGTMQSCIWHTDCGTFLFFIIIVLQSDSGSSLSLFVVIMAASEHAAKLAVTELLATFSFKAMYQVPHENSSSFCCLAMIK